VLVPFGGAGPLHAARIAEELSIDTLCVPPAAGVLSAYGLLASDFVRYNSLTRRLRVEPGVLNELRSVFDHMKAESIAGFAELGMTTGLEFTHVLEMRYVGQAFEVSVELSVEQLQELDEEALIERFNEAHHRIFEFAESSANRIEIVSFRLGASIPPETLPSLRATPALHVGESATIFDRGESVECELLNRLQVPATPRSGPILIEDETSTIYIPQGWLVHLDANQNLIAKTEAQPS
jgi:N-methylhydantoinase A